MSEENENEKKGPYAKDCNGPLNEKCEECEKRKKCYQLRFHKLPYYIWRYYMPELTPNSVKVFSYLCEKAKYNKFASNYGRCWETNEKIAEAAEVSLTNINRQLMQLEDLGLINRSNYENYIKPDGTHGTHRTITICHMIRMKEINGP